MSTGVEWSPCAVVVTRGWDDDAYVRQWDDILAMRDYIDIVEIVAYDNFRGISPANMGCFARAFKTESGLEAPTPQPSESLDTSASNDNSLEGTDGMFNELKVLHSHPKFDVIFCSSELGTSDTSLSDVPRSEEQNITSNCLYECQSSCTLDVLGQPFRETQEAGARGTVYRVPRIPPDIVQVFGVGVKESWARSYSMDQSGISPIPGLQHGSSLLEIPLSQFMHDGSVDMRSGIQVADPNSPVHIVEYASPPNSPLRPSRDIRLDNTINSTSLLWPYARQQCDAPKTRVKSWRVHRRVFHRLI
ncbi:hypothetical protein FRB94_011711 [Tulasnella sp. JGI-2019a]|nr:hypothetical protein FRB94_011711 [Tulasnella sp. JGI-2019a]